MRFRKPKAEQSTQRRRSADNQPPVFSYYARGTSGSAQNTGRGEPVIPRATRRLQLRLGHAPSYVAFVILVVAGLYSLWLQPSPKLVVLSEPGTVHRSTQAYQTAVNSIWRSSLLNQGKLTVHDQQISRDINQQFGELANVAVQLPLLGRRATIVVKPGQPAMRFVNRNGEFYVDINGKVMARVGDVEPNQLGDIPTVRDETGTLADPNKNIISAPEASYLQRLYAQLKAQGLKVQSITLPAQSANEADVRLNDLKYFVKFSTDTDPRQGAGSFLAAKAKLDTDHATPQEYIDVRVDEKVFYK